MRRYKFLWGVGLVLVLLFGLAGVFLSESTLRLGRRPVSEAAQESARAMARALGSDVETVTISAADGVALRGWFFRAHAGNGNAVILLHGQSDNRAGTISYAKLFLRCQYHVLAPDMRAHGDSGGSLATYGLHEAEDMHRWVSWLVDTQRPHCIFGLGESMGAAILLQTLQKESRFCAVVAEAPFCSFREVAYDRVGQFFGMGSWLGRTALRPMLEWAFLYTRLRYNLDFDLVSPEAAAAASHTPILLIHGLKDDNILSRHSQRIFQCKSADQSGNVELWEVPDGGHTTTLGRWPDDFERRVCGWFDSAFHPPSTLP
jgi:pimeloyl-ACP methyl ester carboxylesterase